jgi:hypothetical protein
MFYQLVEKDGTRKGVHSKSDLEYLMARGWKVVKLAVITANKVEPTKVEVPVFKAEIKRRGRPPKVKRG